MPRFFRQSLLIACATFGLAVCHAQTTADTLSMPVLPDSYGSLHVTASLDTNQLTIGSQTTLHIKVLGSDANKVTFPTLEELSQGSVEALEFTADTLIDKNGTMSGIEQMFTVTSFETGRNIIGNIVLRLNTPQGTVLLAPADSLFLDVDYTADADTTKCEVKGDIGTIREPYTFWEIARWVLYALLTAAIIAAIVWALKRHKEHKPIVVLPKSKPVPADKKAIAELESLRRKELWQKGRIKRYYTDLTDIVRRFLRNMYGITATEMTTRQTLHAFHGISDWSEESEASLRQLLQKADMVKFAKSQPEAHEHDLAMQLAVDFVHKVADTHRANNPEEGGESK